MLVEHARVDGVPRQRVQRIVLEDEQPAAGREHTANLAEQCDVLVVRDVMEHARRQRDIERTVRVGNPPAVEMAELGRGAVPSRTQIQALARDVEARHARRGQVPREERHRIADAGAEVERCPGNGMPALELGRDVGNLVLGKILGVLAGQLDVGRVQIPVFVGELVEFDLVHHSPQTSL